MRVSSVAFARLKTKINKFKQSGVLLNDVQKTEESQRSKVPEAFKASTLNKCVQILRNQYDGLLFDDNQKVIDVSRINSRDLKDSRKRGINLIIFKNLMRLKQYHKKPVDKNLLLTLLGVNMKSLKDKVKVTEQVNKLLEQDNGFERARYLLKLSYYKNPVAMNKLIQGIILNYGIQGKTDSQVRKNNIEHALKVFNDCKKWGYEANVQTYAILFGGINKNLTYGELDHVLAKRLVSIYELIKEPQVSTFNALLSCLVKDFTDDQYEAWDLFNKVEGFKPNAQSFTIFFQGLVKLNESKFNSIIRSGIPKIEKNVQIYQLNNQLVDLAPVILNKIAFKQIDTHLISQYIACYINQNHSEMYGHNYSPWGLEILKQLIPELHEFVTKYEIITKPSKQSASKEAFNFTQTIKKLAEDKSNLPKGFDPLDITKRDISVTNKTLELGVNKFILSKFIEGLALIDRPIQFMSSMWKLLHEFSGIHFEKFPSVKKGEYDVEVKVDNSIDPDLETIDSKLIEGIVYHIDQIFQKELKSSTVCLNFIKYCQKKNNLVNDNTYNTLISIIENEYTHFIRSNRVKRLGKQVLDVSQLEYLTKSIQLFVQIAPFDSYRSTKITKLAETINGSLWINTKNAGHIKPRLTEAITSFKPSATV